MKQWKDFKSGDVVVYTTMDNTIFISLISDIDDEGVHKKVSLSLSKGLHYNIVLCNTFTRKEIIREIRNASIKEIQLLIDEIKLSGKDKFVLEELDILYHKIELLNDSNKIKIRTADEINDLNLELYNDKDEFIGNITNEISLLDVCCQVKENKLNDYYLQYIDKYGEKVKATIANYGRVKHHLPFKKSMQDMLEYIFDIN